MAALTSRLKVWLSADPRIYNATRMPYATARFLVRRPHEADYGVFGLFPERRGLFLDVGANAGQSATSFRIYAKNPIFSIEPNPFHEKDLRYIGRLVHDFRYLIVGAGAEEASMELHIPVYRGVPITAEAALDRKEVADSSSLRGHLGARMDGPDFEIVTRSVRIIPLDSLDLFPDFLKLDVQGHESQALIGLRQTLTRSRPILMVEVPDEDTRTFLADLGYVARLYDADSRRLVPEDRPATNVVFLPGD
jgi:FkbM family methyltransferase